MRDKKIIINNYSTGANDWKYNPNIYFAVTQIYDSQSFV